MVVSWPGHEMEILSKPESGKGLFKPNGQGLQAKRVKRTCPNQTDQGLGDFLNDAAFRIS